MSRNSVITLLYLLCLAVAQDVGISAPVCQNIVNGRRCTLQSSVETVAMLETGLMIGASNSLFSMSLNLEVDKTIDLSPETNTYEDCIGFESGQFGNPPSLCKNFVKLIQPVPGENTILVCGTNAFRPKCTLHSSSNISSYRYMTNARRIDRGFSPYSNSSQIIAMLTSEGRFFSGTKFEAFAALDTIGMAPNPLEGSSSFTVNVPMADQHWLHQPTLISSYETDRHIYFFLHERAFEVNQGESVRYSRAVRICKNDDGIATQQNIFRTFQKARISCSSFVEQGTIPYTYNNLQSTFMWVEPDGQRFLYGVFTSPENGPSGSAICKFSFDPNTPGSLSQVFEDGQYLVSQGNPPTWTKVERSSFVCPGETLGDQRSENDALQNQLVFNSITSMGSQPLYTVLGKRIAKIAIDITSYNQSNQTVIYFSTQGGEINQLVIYSEGQRQEKMISHAGSALRHLIIHKNSDETRSLYAATENQVMLQTLGDCSQYGNCFECLDSKDAYCGWTGESCVNKATSSNQDLIQSFLSEESQIVATCGPRSETTTEQSPACQTEPTTITVETEVTEEENTTDVNISGLSATASAISIPDLVGATVGAFVVGIPVGAFVCFIFLKMFVVPRKHKHTISRQRGSSQADTNTVTQVNNRLTDDQPPVQKKDLTMKDNPSYIQTTPMAAQTAQSKPTPITLDPPPQGNTHKRKNSKDINMYVCPEGDKDIDETFEELDNVPPLRSVSVPSLQSQKAKPNSYSYNYPANGVGRKKIPGYRIPRGRTDSTTWLRADSMSSEPPSPMDPLASPISDV